MISLIHASTSKRMEATRKCVELWKARASADAVYEHLLCVAPEDADKYAGAVVSLLPGVVHQWNAGAAVCKGDIIVTVADDLEPPQDWDKILSARLPLDRPAVLAVADGLRVDKLLCHPIMNRLQYQRQGFIFHPDFQASSGIFADNHFTDTAYADKVVIEARDVTFKHNWAGTKVDGLAATHNAWRNYRVGRQIYRRMHPLQGFGSIAVGVRIAAAPDPDFFVSWTNLLRCGLRPHDQILNPAQGLPHSCAANFILEEFLRTNCDSLLYLDDDMVFAWDTIEKLRKSEGEYSVVAALSTSRRSPFNPIAFRLLPEGNIQIVPNVELVGVIPVDVVGLACTLIRREVIDALMEKRNDDHNLFRWDNRVGEDGSFCADVRQHGFKIGLNCDIAIGHKCAMAASWGQKDNSPVMTYVTYGGKGG